MFKKKDRKVNNSELSIELVLLKSVSNDVELNMLKGLLEQNEIPYIVREHGIGGYMRIITGSGSLYGTDILVEKSQLEQALSLLEEFY